MNEIDFSNFEQELEKRLDTILCEDSQDPKVPKKKNDRLIIYPLHNLKKIVLSLEWEITEDSVIQYLKQLKYLQQIFAKDKNIMVLIKIQNVLGKYIKRFKADTHPYAFTMVQNTFRSLDKIISGKNMTDVDKRKIVSLEIKRYKKLKGLIEENKNVYQKRRINKKLSHARSIPTEKDLHHKPQRSKIYTQEFLIYRRLFENSISEMKLFIRNELKKLKIELQAIKSQE